MWIVASLLSLPLAWLFAGTLSLSNHWAHSASEQIQLDALTLSLCHTRKSFLEAEIESANTRISQIQSEMDQLAEACMADPAATPEVLPVIQVLAETGQRLSFDQDIHLLNFKMKESEKLKELIRNNQLTEDRGKLEILQEISHGFSGLNRQTPSPRRQAFEAFFGVKWPRLIVASEDVAELNTIEINWYPNRSLMGSRLAPLETNARQVTEKGFAAIRSECDINRQGSTWIVERLK